MVSDSQPLPTTENAASLLERARYALQALQFEEEAARYRVAYAELMEAIVAAEAGNPTSLKHWLLERRTVGDANASDASNHHHTATSLTAVQSTPAPTQVSLQTEKPSGARSVANHKPDDASSTQPSGPLASPTASPWDSMSRASKLRAKLWLESEQVTAPESIPTSLDIALGNRKINEDATVKKRVRVLPPHVSVSLVVHGIMIAILAWWVVVIAKPEKQLSITVGENDFQEVALETTLEREPSEMTPSEDPESAPTTDVETTPIDVPKIAAIESGVGPPIANSTLSTVAGNLNGAAGMGTNLAAGAEFFGAKAAGNTFIFVVDCSPSMARDKAFDSAKAEILRSLSMLKPKQRFYILFFGAEIAPLQFGGLDPEPYMVRANQENLERTMQWIQRINIQKEGRHPIDVMRQAIDMDPDAIFLLFDGDTKVNNWVGRIRQMNQTDDLFSSGETKIPIHVVHFFRDEFVTEMKRLAEENKGTYRFVPRPKKGTNR